MRILRSILFALAAPSALAGCDSGGPTVEPRIERDPLIVQALNDQLMVDPDLAMQNEANAALTISFDRTLPLIDKSPATIAVIRDEMRMKLLEGGPVLDLPKVQNLASGRDLAGPCAKDGQLDRSAIWAARLPDFATIPPRGATIAGAGRDTPGCNIRLVTYRTPLGAREAMRFHFTLASRGGLEPKLSEQSKGVLELRGTRSGAGLIVRATPMPDGLLTVEITSLETDS